jgi:glycerol-3-phosphate dehydrogenase
LGLRFDRSRAASTHLRLRRLNRSRSGQSLIAQSFSNHYFRVYTGSDEIGSEIGVAMKNPIAICSGILKGLGYGDNARAALMTRGLHEMAMFGIHFGAKPETYLGLTGLGDLDVTTSSLESRNFRAGLEIGKADGMQTYQTAFAGSRSKGSRVQTHSRNRPKRKTLNPDYRRAL